MFVLVTMLCCWWWCCCCYVVLIGRRISFEPTFVLIDLSHQTSSAYDTPFIEQKKGRRRPNASVPNTPIESPWFAKRPTDPTFQTLIKRSISFRQIWQLDSFIMLSGSEFSLLQRRRCFYSVRIRFLPTVSLWNINSDMFDLYWTGSFVCKSLAALMSTVYEEQKDEDGFLYVQYSGESTFGWND